MTPVTSCTVTISWSKSGTTIQIPNLDACLTSVPLLQVPRTSKSRVRGSVWVRAWTGHLVKVALHSCVFGAGRSSWEGRSQTSRRDLWWWWSRTHRKPLLSELEMDGRRRPTGTAAMTSQTWARRSAFLRRRRVQMERSRHSHNCSASCSSGPRARPPRSDWKRVAEEHSNRERRSRVPICCSRCSPTTGTGISSLLSAFLTCPHFP